MVHVPLSSAALLIVPAERVNWPTMKELLPRLTSPVPDLVNVPVMLTVPFMLAVAVEVLAIVKAVKLVVLPEPTACKLIVPVPEFRVKVSAKPLAVPSVVPERVMLPAPANP